MIILQLPTSEELWMTDENELAVKDVLKNIPDDMVIDIYEAIELKELEDITVDDWIYDDGKWFKKGELIDKLTKHELFSY